MKTHRERRRRSTRPWSGEAIASLALAITVIAAGCDTRVVETRDPTVIGVVSRVEIRLGTVAHIDLATGAALDIDQNGRVRALIGGAPQVGDLLFFGDRPEPWFAAVTRARNGRFEVSGKPDSAADSAITLDSGLRLKVAPGYRELGGPIEPGAPVTYVIDEIGQVVERR